MDFISWFFTHVSQLEFMLLASLPVAGVGGVEQIMREDVPAPPMEHLVAQMQGDRAASGDPVREGPLFL